MANSLRIEYSEKRNFLGTNDPHLQTCYNEIFHNLPSHKLLTSFENVIPLESGITALIYEIVWTRMLTLVFGHTVFSVSVVLAAFMAGLGLGSYIAGYAVDRLSINTIDSSATALKVYGWIEILIFASGALISLLFLKFSGVYSLFHSFIPESTELQNLLKIFFSFILILIPTTLMGTTLPIISKYCVTNDKVIGKQVCLLYALNTLGAVFGCLATGFFLMETFGVLQTVLFAAGINLLVGISALSIYKENGGTIKFTFPKISIPKINWSPMKSENLYGITLKELGTPRHEFKMMTKGSPMTGGETRKLVEEQLTSLKLDFVDFYGWHGINNEERLLAAIKPGGPVETLHRLKEEGLIRHIGFSTHAALDIILQALDTDLFSFVNLHYYYFFQRNPLFFLYHQIFLA